MNHDDYIALRKGKLVPLSGIRSMITDVGAGVYAYMVMLGISERLYESKFYEDIRTRVFDIRDQITNDITQEVLDQLSSDMKMVYHDLNTAYTFLLAHKPDESSILQSVINTACGLIHNIKHFKDKEC